MHKKLIVLAVLSTLGWQNAYSAEPSVETQTPASKAGSEIQNLKNPGARNLEKRIEFLEKQLKKKEGEEKEEIEEEKPSPTVEFSGVIEIEGSYVDADGADSSETDLVLSTFELGLGAPINRNFRADASILYEDDGDSELDIDTAFISYINDSESFATVAGLFYLPFGSYETGLISDPLTLELGETADTALMGHFPLGPIGTSIYAFRGDSKDDGDINTWGLNFGYKAEIGTTSTTLNLGYISNMAETDGLLDAVGEGGIDSDVPGIALSGAVALGSIVLIGEYITASDNFATSELAFNGADAEPSAWNLEFDYITRIGSKEGNFAIAYQGSEEADGLLPETKMLLGFTFNILENVSFGLEYSVAEDYTGDKENAIVAQLGATF